MWLWKLRFDCWQACLSFEVRIWLPEHECVCKNSDHAFDCWTLSLTIGSLTSLWNIGIGCGVAHVDHQNAVLTIEQAGFTFEYSMSLFRFQCDCWQSHSIVTKPVWLLQIESDRWSFNVTLARQMLIVGRQAWPLQHPMGSLHDWLAQERGRTLALALANRQEWPPLQHWSFRWVGSAPFYIN